MTKKLFIKAHLDIISDISSDTQKSLMAFNAAAVRSLSDRHVSLPDSADKAQYSALISSERRTASCSIWAN